MYLIFTETSLHFMPLIVWFYWSIFIQIFVVALYSAFFLQERISIVQGHSKSIESVYATSY